MPDRDRLTRENAALRERLDRLIDASLRINASLDLHTVLPEVLEAARALTDARWGVSVTIDAEGGVEDFVCSGLTEGELERMVAWPHGPDLWAHLRDLPGPLRQDDMSAYVAGRGFSSHWVPDTTFQGTPMRHRGVHVGSCSTGPSPGAATGGRSRSGSPPNPTARTWPTRCLTKAAG